MLNANKINASEFTRKVWIQTATRTRNAEGGQVLTWGDVSNPYCKIEPYTGREYDKENSMQSEVTHRITMWYRTGVDTTQRLIGEAPALIYEIVYVADVENLHKFLVIDCKVSTGYGVQQPISNPEFQTVSIPVFGDLTAGELVGATSPTGIQSLSWAYVASQLGTASGAQGPQGIQGAIGSQGNVGVQGLSGSTGNQGNDGPAGVAGVQGSSGTNGNNGATGAQGVSGSGLQGVQGVQGSIGATGNVGVQGNDGSIGSAGTQGLTGAQGATGNQGVAGVAGVSGVQGATGAVGSQGVNGLQGNTGSAGATGVQGIQGAVGSQGNDGATGNAGVQGVAGSNGVNGVQGATGATGSQGNDGPAGVQGVSGSTGVAGVQGVQGIQGVQGTAGTNGSNGATGPQGFTGATGNTGNAGVQGVAGSNGSNGSNGSAGVQGFQGIQGVQGTKGPQGLTGNVGVQGFTGLVGGYTFFYAFDNSNNQFPGAGNIAIRPSNTLSTVTYIGINLGDRNISNVNSTLASVAVGSQYKLYDDSGINFITGIITSSTVYSGSTNGYGYGVTVVSSHGSFTNAANINFSFGLVGVQGVQGTVGTTGNAGVQGSTGATGNTGVQGFTGSGTYNYLIDGDFNVWQRFTAGVQNSASTYGGCVGDRWALTSGFQTISNGPQAAQYSLAGSTNSSANYMAVCNKKATSQQVACSQIIESQVCYALRNRPVIFQAMCWQPDSQNVRMAIISTNNTVVGDSFTAAQLDCVSSWSNNTYTTGNFFKSTQSGGAGTVTYKVVGVSSSITATSSGTISSVSGTVPTDCQNLICIAWTESAINNNKFLAIAQAGLFDGSTVVPWLPRLYQEELALAQRYYEYQYIYKCETCINANTYSLARQWDVVKRIAAVPSVSVAFSNAGTTVGNQTNSGNNSIYGHGAFITVASGGVMNIEIIVTVNAEFV